MIRIEVPTDDYAFLRKHFDGLDRYLVRVEYTHTKVSFEIPNDKFDDFLLDYRSMIARKGTLKESFNEDGLRMNRILNSYIQLDPLLK